jgi:flavin reductase (DIM6/NTAB) family NADH-FMN oxidoreductase RutF
LSDPYQNRELRNAFGHFATGVTVVTAFDEAGRAVGVTANSFSSLSLDPPLVLWCIGRQSATFDVFRVVDRFVVSVLAADAVALSRRFAIKGEHFVTEREGMPSELGPPAVAGALSVFECVTHARYEGGDHIILVGRVTRFVHASDRTGVDARPLVYYRGRYCTATELSG